MERIKHSYCLRAIALAWLALIIVSPSCLSDEVVNHDDERGYIVMSLNNAKTKGTREGALFSDDAEKTISKVRVFVFHGLALEVNRLFVAGNENFSNPFRVEVATGIKDVYVVANESDALTATLSGVKSRDDLKKVMTDEINAPVSLPLPMVGELKRVTVDKPKSSGEPHNMVKIELTRIVAKIKINFKKSNDEDVKITAIRLISNAAKSSLLPSSPAPIATTYWDYTKHFDTPINLTTDFKPMGETIYLYENMTGGDKTHATRMEVDALFNNIITTYRVYINETVTSPGSQSPGNPTSSEVTGVTDHPYCIKRGYQYNINGTIGKVGDIDGLLLQCSVLPWNLIETEQTFDETPISVTTTPKFTSVDGHETSKAKPFSFEFTLTDGPENATWDATLDNGLEFGFDIVENTHGKIGETKTITIKPLKSFNSNITRTTNFYITVTNPANGIKEKVKLVQDSDETYITIKQVKS